MVRDISNHHIPRPVGYKWRSKTFKAPILGLNLTPNRAGATWRNSEVAGSSPALLVIQKALSGAFCG